MKVYEIYWQELVTNRVTVIAEDEADAMAAFEAGDFHDVDYGIETEYFGEYPASVEEQE